MQSSRYETLCTSLLSIVTLQTKQVMTLEKGLVGMEEEVERDEMEVIEERVIRVHLIQKSHDQMTKLIKEGN